MAKHWYSPKTVYDNARVDFSLLWGLSLRSVDILLGMWVSWTVGMGQGRGYELSVLLLRVLSSSSSEESPP